MENLTRTQRQELSSFHKFMETVSPQDFLPPDAGVREPQPDPWPPLPPAQAACALKLRNKVVAISERRSSLNRGQQLGHAGVSLFERSAPVLLAA
jgi:hypothetical protein